MMDLLGTMSIVAALAGAGPTENPIEAPGPNGALEGSLVTPAASRPPVILMIPGSGPTDRDGNNSLGIKAASYRLLAKALAADGIASARIDKRGMFGSAAAIADPNAVTIGDYVKDTGSWIGAINARTGAKCIWVLGHSEGGLVALAGRDLPGICGLILVAPPGRPMGEIVRSQLKANPANAPLLDEAFAAIAKLEAGKNVDISNFHPSLKQLFAPQIQNFLISAFSYDPASMIRGYKKPVLIVQGGADLQVSVDDAQRLARANPNAKLIVLPNVNHVLKEVVGGDPKANLSAYANPDLPIAAGVAESISAFVKASKPKP